MRSAAARVKIVVRAGGDRRCVGASFLHHIGRLFTLTAKPRNVLTRFDAFVLIVADIGRPTHGHTDGYDGLGLGLNRYVKICMCYRSNSVYTRPGSAYIYAFIYKAQA